MAGRADEDVDRALDAAMDRLHDVVSRKLANDPALHQLTQEAASGRESPTARTRQRVLLALEEADETDTGFASDLEQAVAHLQSLARAPGSQPGGDHIDDGVCHRLRLLAGQSIDHPVPTDPGHARKLREDLHWRGTQLALHSVLFDAAEAPRAGHGGAEASPGAGTAPGSSHTGQ